MARYVYSNLSTLPARSEAPTVNKEGYQLLHCVLCRSSNAEFLISGGPSKTWLMGHTLVTVTTSGQGDGKTGVCRRCAAFRTRTRIGDLPSQIEETTQELGKLNLPGGTPDQVFCSCWRKGWAEILIRRPTGNISWLMRLQNRLHPLSIGEPYSPSNADWSLLAPTYPCEVVGKGAKLGPPPGGEDESSKPKGKPPKPQRDSTAALPGPASDSGGSSPELLTPRANHTPTASLNPEQSPNIEISAGELKTVSLEEGVLNLDDEGERSQPSLRLEETATPLSNSGSGAPPTPQPSPSRRQPTSKSWSEQGACEAPPLSPRPSSYSALVVLEHLPPLLSYDTGDDLGRSPSLRSSGGRLSDQEQVRLFTCLLVSIRNSQYIW